MEANNRTGSGNRQRPSVTNIMIQAFAKAIFPAPIAFLQWTFALRSRAASMQAEGALAIVKWIGGRIRDSHDGFLH